MNNPYEQVVSAIQAYSDLEDKARFIRAEFERGFITLEQCKSLLRPIMVEAVSRETIKKQNKEKL